MLALKIVESYVSRKAPANAAGARRGYGLTRAQAHADADHWNNQAPYAKTRTVTVRDYAKPAGYSQDCEIAWRILGLHYIEGDPTRDAARALIDAGKYAQAVRILLAARGK